MEIWKKCDILGDYSISTLGRLRNNKTNRIRKLITDKNGYKVLTIFFNKKAKYFAIHRLVLQTFKPICDSEKYHAHHIDFDTSNNNLENLEWLLPEDNLSLKRNYISKSYPLYKKLLSKFGDKQLESKLKELFT